MNMQLADITRQLINIANYCSLATATPSGDPWVVPLFYNFDAKQKLFYWVSVQSSQHSQLITRNPRVALTIFNSQAPFGMGQGVYIVGKARESTMSELPEAMDCYFGGKYPIKDKRKEVSAGDFSGAAPRRIYVAKPERVWILQYPQVPQSEVVDVRVEVQL
jgi:uncharacterized protein YhbP (UPF0306 family)